MWILGLRGLGTVQRCLSLRQLTVAYRHKPMVIPTPDANWYSQYLFVCFLAGSGLIIILLSTTIAIFVLSILILLVFCGWIHKKTGL